jgi:hypothetical protein
MAQVGRLLEQCTHEVDSEESHSRQFDHGGNREQPPGNLPIPLVGRKAIQDTTPISCRFRKKAVAAVG